MSINGMDEKMDKWDYLMPLFSGTLTGILDTFLVKDLSFSEAHGWGCDKADEIVVKAAKKYGFNNVKDRTDAIRKFEDTAKIAADKATADFGGGKFHHIRDFTHHASPLGFLCSILTQFTHKCYGTDTQGNFIKVDVSEGIGKNFSEKIFNGTIQWFLHMLSDFDGSSSTRTANKSSGTGVPGPFLSFLKETSAMPGIKRIAGKDENDNWRFSKACTKLFDGTMFMQKDSEGKIIKDTVVKFDLRTEMGITHQMFENKQYLPVLINEIIVRAFYSITRLVREIEEKEISSFEEFDKIDMKRVLPFNNKNLTHMLTIACTVFTITDISGSAIKAALKNRNNKKGFALDLFQGINYFGIGRMFCAHGGEVAVQIQAKIAKYADSEVMKISSDAMMVAKVANPVGMVTASVTVFERIMTAFKEAQIAKEERLLIEETTRKAIEIINRNKEEMQAVVEQYLVSHMEEFNKDMDCIDCAVQNNDLQGFINGNNAIQAFLGYDVKFENMEEFDDLMLSNDTLIL